MPLRGGQWLASFLGVALIGCATAGSSRATEADTKFTFGMFGPAALIDMPVATSLPDGQLAITASHFAGQTRTMLSFQLTPRLLGSFRYSSLSPWPDPRGKLFDRSFDLHLRFIDEGRIRPAVAIGLRDFIGTGVYAGEYFAATKAVRPGVTVTGGIGWGRLGSHNGFARPFGRRPVGQNKGGQPSAGQWFRGPVAFFGGAAWDATDKLTLKIEYSSDAYTQETRNGAFTRHSSVNFGADYRVGKQLRVGAYYLYGREIGVAASFAIDPKGPPAGGWRAPAPIPVFHRPNRARNPDAWSTAWAGQDAPPAIREKLDMLLKGEGLTAVRLELTATQAILWLRNPRFDAAPQALGRTARAMSATLPASVETFMIVPVVEGMTVSVITLKRSDVEELGDAPDGAWRTLARARVADAADLPTGVASSRPGSFPGSFAGAGLKDRLDWNIGPYLTPSLFDPDNPVRADAGIKLAGQFFVARGLSFSGAVTRKIIGNLDQSNFVSDSVIAHVRSDYANYDRRSDQAIEYLTIDQFSRPATNIYGRVSAGYLERMYAGFSGEVLWKPVSSRLALGTEVNYVQQRAFGQGLSLRDYDVVTGHASVYYDIGGGFLGQVDYGRYLARDWGYTVTLDREFANGWSVGAYFTLTDVSFNQFGEGSFDKGIRLTVPFGWLLGQPSRAEYKTVIRPLTRDGGARLNVRNRLYDFVREYHTPELDEKWGTFWR